MLRRALKRSTEESKPVVSKKLRAKSKTRAKGKKKRYHKSRPVLGSKDREKAEEILEGLVLGGDDDFIKTFEDIGNKEKPKKEKTKDRILQGEGRKPAWEDKDDNLRIDRVRKWKTMGVKANVEVRASQYAQHLKWEFEKISAKPKWADLDSKEQDSGDSDVDDLLRGTGNYLVKSSALPPDILDIKQCPDANKEAPAMGKLQSVEFHPSAQVVLTAGLSQTLSLFQVDGRTNPKIQSVFMENFPITTAHFSYDGNQVILGSRMRSFYYYDMISGKVINVPKIKALEGDKHAKFEVSPDGRFIAFLGSYGATHLISAKSKEWIDTLKMNGTVESVAFSRDGSKMFSFGDEGNVYVWDLQSRSCVHRFIDEGCIKGTKIAASHNGQYLACGSYSGIVNVYDTETCLSQPTPKPLHAVMNLTTPCTSAVFNSSTEILAVASDASNMAKAVKLVHFPSMRVFSNFPEQYTDKAMKRPQCLDFSVNGGYLTVGCQNGQALLYRVKHYENF